jgi:hypothetical protein
MPVAQRSSDHLSDDAFKVLRLVHEQATDGYTVMSRTGLTGERLEVALRELVGSSLVAVKGEAYGPSVGAAYLWVPPDVQGYVGLLLGKFRPSSTTT